MPPTVCCGGWARQRPLVALPRGTGLISSSAGGGASRRVSPGWRTITVRVPGTSVKLLGIIPDDEAIITSTNRGEPVSMTEGTLAGQAYRNIARRLKGETVPFLDLEEKTGFFDKLKKLFASS